MNAVPSPPPERRRSWHTQARDYLDMYGIDPAVVEAAIDNPTSDEPDPTSADRGYPVRRYRRGDVQVTVGYRDPREPLIMYVHLCTPGDHYIRPGRSGGRVGGRSAPKTTQELIERVEAAGYEYDPVGRHPRIRRKDGSALVFLAGTPSDVRSLSNAWHQFLRATGDALD